MNTAKILNPARRLVEVGREQGMRYVLWLAFSHLSKRLATPGFITAHDLGFEGLLRQSGTESASRPTPKEGPLRIVWVSPMASPGGGGMANIVNLAAALTKRGHHNTLCFVSEQHRQPNMERVAADFAQWYGRHDVELTLLDRPLHGAMLPPADVVIATAWPTAYIVAQLPGDHMRAYFVQDYEPWFYPRGSESLLADNTYTMNFHFLALGHWLEQELRDHYGKTASVVDFPVDTTVFYPRATSRPQRFRVAFYVRTSTPRRSSELGILALRSFVQQAGGGVEVLLFGDSYLSPQNEFTSLGALSRDQLAELYSSVDVVLSLSATNMSLIPREAAACGAAILELDLPPVRAHLTHEYDAYLAAPTSTAIAEGLLRLHSDRDLCRSLARNGQLAVQALPNWDVTATAIEESLRGEMVRL